MKHYALPARIGKIFWLAITVAFLLCTTAQSQAGDHKKEHRNAIVLAMFGTTVEPALQGLLNIKNEISKAYPETTVKIAFTSNIIRKIWQKRAKNPEYVNAHPHVSTDILHAQGPLATIANLQDQGFDNIIVQSTHLAPAEEFLDLSAYVKALASIETIKAKFKPFHSLVIGRPAFGIFGKKHPYNEDITAAAKALSDDVELARKEKSALIYMGHGNTYFPSGGIYLQFQNEMQSTYPDVKIFVGTVEGFPSLDDVIESLQEEDVKKVVIKPLMTVAGNHARNDMAGAEPDSWKSILEKTGITVIPVLRGLGEQNGFAGIFVSHLADAAFDAGIDLK